MRKGNIIRILQNCTYIPDERPVVGEPGPEQGMRVFFSIKREGDGFRDTGAWGEKRGGTGSKIAVFPAPACTVHPSAVGTR